MTTIFPVAPDFISFFAADKAPPDDEPAKMPSFFANSLEPPKASSSVIFITLSTSYISIVSAIKSLPIPSIL